MRSRPRSTPLALLLAGSLAGPLLGQPRLVERVLAVVNEAPVLLSDVRLVASLRGLSAEQALEAAIDERLMLQEAERLSQAALSKAEIEAAVASLRARLPEGSQLSQSGLRRLARRQATILKYVDFRFLPQVSVSDDAVRAAYEEEIRGLPSPPALEERASALRQQLERQALDQRIEAWVRELRASARIRRNPTEPRA